MINRMITFTTCVLLVTGAAPAVAHDVRNDTMTPMTSMTSMTSMSRDSRGFPMMEIIRPGECPYVALQQNLDKVNETFHALPESTRMNLQHILRHAGLYDGPDDGIWGPRTDCAMRAVVGRFMNKAPNCTLSAILYQAGRNSDRTDRCAVANGALHTRKIMNDVDMIGFFEYMLDGGFIRDIPGTPHPVLHRDTLY